ncbi:hypothetical protein [Psychromonas algicola]|uniref:hypothetical protein n=1 Tax=Psychromonas algicola TaxID=2555642 RepID=UPI00106809C6|nr:hypothetical protein [Psychromonas sp. RZ5]TEW51783.1 hypothetical protein E2R67_06075 [Psychromonas sp. RZ5]
MHGAYKNVLINDDEYAMLSEMLLDTETTNDKGLKYDISGQSGKDKLLFQLAFADDLQLVANYADHYLVFPVQIERGDFSNFSLTVKSPNIFETGEHLRSWRLPANQKMSIVNNKGEKLPYCIKDLSASGISLLIDKQQAKEFPLTLQDTYLQLPNRKRLAISGSKIRRVDEQTMAYSLEDSTEDDVLDCLTEYLFECHAEQHGRRLE